ncbi:hypothetical protein TcWFU_005666 [Taenia crassiceps]|uniref:Uncharacterized protein n=1 Tax=Taenia crassiceps TaxID=6207 RepID=A0ABR4Q733_9CEST
MQTFGSKEVSLRSNMIILTIDYYNFLTLIDWGNRQRLNEFTIVSFCYSISIARCVSASIHAPASTMNEVQWSLSLSLNPLQLSNPRDALDFYIKPHLNKYVRDLKGILVHVNKQSVGIHPSPDLKTPRDNGSQCIIRFLPEYPLAKVNFLVNATVFCASVGLHVDATVTVVKHHRIVCRYGDTFSIYIIVPLQGLDAETLPDDPESGNPLSIFPRDLVQVEIARVTYSPAGDSMFLSGRILSVLKRGNLARKILGLPFDNEEGEEAVASEAKPDKSRKRKFNHLESQDDMTSAKKKARSKKFEEHHGEENEEGVDRLGENGQVQETSQLVRSHHAAPSEKSAKKRKSKKHEVVEDEAWQNLGAEVGLEQLQETPALLSSDQTTASKKRRSKRHSVLKGAEERLLQEMETDAVSDQVQEIPGVAKPDPMAVSEKRSSKKSLLVEKNEAEKSVSLKSDPDSLLVQSVNTRKTSRKARRQEVAPVMEAEEEEETVEKETESPLLKCPRSSGLLKQDSTESHWRCRRKLRMSEQSPDISTSSAEGQSDVEARTPVVTRS